MRSRTQRCAISSIPVRLGWVCAWLWTVRGTIILALLVQMLYNSRTNIERYVSMQLEITEKFLPVFCSPRRIQLGDFLHENKSKFVQWKKMVSTLLRDNLPGLRCRYSRHWSIIKSERISWVTHQINKYNTTTNKYANSGTTWVKN